MESQVDASDPVVGEGSKALSEAMSNGADLDTVVAEDPNSKTESIPAPLPDPRSKEGDEGLERETDPLLFDDVLISVTETFPAIREAALIRDLALGNQTAALGEFDDKLEAFTIN